MDKGKKLIPKHSLGDAIDSMSPTMRFGLEFIPGVGTFLNTRDAFNNPTWLNWTVAGLTALGDITGLNVLSKALKARKLAKLTKAKMVDAEKALYTAEMATKAPTSSLLFLNEVKDTISGLRNTLNKKADTSLKLAYKSGVKEAQELRKKITQEAVDNFEKSRLDFLTSYLGHSEAQREYQAALQASKNIGLGVFVGKTGLRSNQFMEDLKNKLDISRYFDKWFE